MSHVSLPRGCCLCAIAVMAIALSGSAAPADTISATLVDINSGSPYETVNVTFNGFALDHAIAGIQNWQRQSGTQFRGSNFFDTFCVDIVQDVRLGGTYSYNVSSNIADAPKPGTYVQTLGTGTGMGSIRADMIAELWAKFYTPDMSEADAAAFQTAIWELVYENRTSG